MSAEHNFPDRNLALELVRVTETAAVAASAWVGRGDKDAADGSVNDFVINGGFISVSNNRVSILGESAN